MKTQHYWATPLAAMITGAALTAYPYMGAFALIDDSPLLGPPNGYSQLCSPSAINVTPSENSRKYVAQGTCWINVAQDKTDPNKQSWIQTSVTTSGVYSLANNSFSELLTVNAPSGSSSVTIVGSCNDDPWATKATCSDKGNPSSALSSKYGWGLSTSGQFPQGPLSSLVYSPELIQAMLSKQKSNPPLAPVGLDPVRWPEGKDEVGEVKWRAGDMSDNKWVMQFDIEYANYADSTYTKAGQRVGPGPKKNMSATDANMVYVFMTPFKLQSSSYFFRVCASNDVGRQCSAPVLARKPTQMELMSAVSRTRTSVGLQAIQRPTTKSPASPVEKSATRVFGAALIAKSGGSTGGTSGSGGAGGLGGTGGSGGGTGSGGSTPGSTGPSSSNKPDLAVASDGIQVNDRAMTLNATNRLVLHPDASNTCPVHVSFRYTNLGKKVAKNVVAELRDSQQKLQPIATNKDPKLAQGQFSTVSGTNKFPVSTTEAKVIYSATVFEKGKPNDDSNISNNRGEVTLYVLCQASGGGKITAAPYRAPTSVGATGSKMPTMQR